MNRGSMKSPKSSLLWYLMMAGLGQLYNKDYILKFVLLISEFGTVSKGVNLM